MLPVNANIPFLGIKPVPIRPYQPRQYPARTALGRLGRRRVSGADIGSGGQRAGNGDIDDLDVVRPRSVWFLCVLADIMPFSHSGLPIICQVRHAPLWLESKV